MVTAVPIGALAIDAGELPLKGGLLALVRPALDLLPPGAVLAVLSSAPSARHELPAWCRAEHHAYLGSEPDAEGRDRHVIIRGHVAVPLGRRESGRRLPRRGGRLFTADMLAMAPMPERADPASGFAPRGARIEPGGPAYPFTLNHRDGVAPPEVAQLYDQAVALQWDAGRDVPWDRVGRHAAPLEAAVGQIMTFLAESAAATLYVPARFLPRIHPAYVEVSMFLATQLADAARHIDVFLKRARVGGGALGLSTLTGARSLLSLLELEDFTEFAFLFAVLGEGTCLDLLRFVEEHAPDEATAVIARRTRSDQARHVHFGLLHVRHALASDPTAYERLAAAAGRRAAALRDLAMPAPLQDALTILAAASTEPQAVAAGHQAFQGLLDTMHQNRLSRLEHAGFSPGQAEMLSELHSPNLI